MSTSLTKGLDVVGEKITSTGLAQLMIELTERRYMFLFSLLLMMVISITIIVLVIIGRIDQMLREIRLVPFRTYFALTGKVPQMPKRRSYCKAKLPRLPQIFQQPTTTDVVVDDTTVYDSAQSEKYTARYPAGPEPGSIYLGNISPTVNVGDKTFENPQYTRYNALWEKSNDESKYFDDSIAPWYSRKSPFAQE